MSDTNYNPYKHLTRVITVDRNSGSIIAKKMDIVECCKIGPIMNENFCPECGKKIIR